MVSSQAQAPSDQVHDILRSFKEWLRVQEARLGRIPPDHNGYGSAENQPSERYFSPSVGPVGPHADPDRANHKIPPSRPSVRKRVFRTFVYGFVLIVFVGAALAWWSSDDPTKGLFGASLGELSSILGTNSTSTSGSQSVAKSPDQASVAAARPSDLQHQLETMTNDLAVMRHVVEELAAKQELMAQAIATLQTAQQNVSERLSSLPQSAAADQARRNAPRTGHSDAGAQSSPVPVPIARPILPQRPN